MQGNQAKMVLFFLDKQSLHLLERNNQTILGLLSLSMCSVSLPVNSPVWALSHCHNNLFIINGTMLQTEGANSTSRIEARPGHKTAFLIIYMAFYLYIVYLMIRSKQTHNSNTRFRVRVRD